jgi:large subunit ribosomal protein L24
MRFKIGDEVLVTSGRDRGKRGKIERIFPADGKMLVAGVNLFKKHVRETTDRTKTGGIIQFAKPLSPGSLAMVCKHCTEPTRIGYKTIDGKKVRICRKCKEEL